MTIDTDEENVKRVLELINKWITDSENDVELWSIIEEDLKRYSFTLRDLSNDEEDEEQSE